MAYSEIGYERENSAAVIRLNRPEKLNAMTRSMIAELFDALERARSTDGVRAIVLTGEGEAFSSGWDFDGDEEMHLDEFMVDKDHNFYDDLVNFELPIIAAVNGYAIAGGTNLVDHCDIAIASEEAEFGYPEVHMGGLPGSFIHAYDGLSIKHAKELFFTGKMIDAEEAERIGLVNRTVPAGGLMDEVWDLVDQIKLTPHSTVELSKTMLNDAMRSKGYRDAGKLDHYLWALSWNTQAGEKFREIQEEEGLDDAIDWMHTAEKDLID